MDSIDTFFRVYDNLEFFFRPLLLRDWFLTLIVCLRLYEASVVLKVSITSVLMSGSFAAFDFFPRFRPGRRFGASGSKIQQRMLIFFVKSKVHSPRTYVRCLAGNCEVKQNVFGLMMRVYTLYSEALTHYCCQ